MGSLKVSQPDDSSIRILEDILKTTRSTGEGVDAVYYRAQHDSQIDRLNKLEQNGFLRKHDNKYWVSLYGLTLVNDKESKALLENCENIFPILRSHYRSQPKDKMMVVDLARLSNLTFKEVGECLGYMVEAHWAGGYTTLFNNPAEAFIHPSEEILKYQNFQEIVSQVVRWRTEREVQSAQDIPGLFSSAFPLESPPEQQPKRFPGLHPWGVISALVFDLNSDEVVEIISLTGLQVDWSLTPKESYSHNTRKRAYRPRVDTAFSRLDDSEKLRAAWVVSSELVRRHADKETELRQKLSTIGWTLDAGVIRPTSGEVAELFFPRGSEHDVYIRLRDIIKSAQKSITVVDPYLDSTILTLLGTSEKSLEVQLLSHNLPSDFVHEVSNFKKQHTPQSIEVRRTRDFHDRFIVIDGASCFHIGASIKDAGSRAFMINQMQDQANVRTLLDQIRASWQDAAPA